MKRLRRIFAAVLIIILVFEVCPKYSVAAAVKLNKTKSVLYVGSTVKLTISGTGKKVTWSSKTKSIASVSSTGKVTAKKAGKTTIIAKVGKKKYECKITVKNPYLNSASRTMYVGGKYTLKITGTKASKWESTDKKIVTVSSKGVIHTIKAGKANIVCKGKNGKKYICKVTVKNPICTHSSTKLINVKKAGCTTAGYTGDKYCILCKKIIKRGSIIKATGHNWSNLNGICKNCGLVCDHAYTAIRNKKAAGCTTAGYTGDKYCTVCKKLLVKGSVIAATGHDWSNHDGICKTCGYECEHANTEIRNATAAGCTTDGYTGDTYCTVCNKLLTTGSVTQATGHDWSNHDGICKNCGLECEHEYINGVCTICGKTDPAYAPKSIAKGCMPATGDAKLVVFNISYKDKEDANSQEDIEKMMFSQEDNAEADKGFDSVSLFYKRSSYGKLNITGDVFTYVTQKNSTEYTSARELYEEVINYYRNTGEIDWKQYDVDSDGYLDGVYFLVAEACGVTNYRGCVSNYSWTIDGRKIVKAVELCGEYVDTSTIVHETCHMIGPPDIYARVSVNPGGTGAMSVMDGGYGDLPGIMKYVLGWIDDPIVVSQKDVNDYTLKSYSTNDQIMIIYPENSNTSKFWFVVEYVTPEANNTYFNNSGIRVWRCVMNYDDNGKITGIDTITDGMIDSPFLYLDTINPEASSTHFYTNGQSIITSGLYGSYYSENVVTDSYGNAYLSDPKFSGVNIMNIALDGENASFSVKIEDQPSETEKEYTITEFISGGTFAELDENGNVLVATISSGSPVSVLDSSKVVLLTDGENEWTTSLKLENNRSAVKVYLSAQTINEMSGKDVELHVPAGLIKNTVSEVNKQQTVAIKGVTSTESFTQKGEYSLDNPYTYSSVYSFVGENGQLCYIRQNIAYGEETGEDHILSLISQNGNDVAVKDLEHPLDATLTKTSQLEDSHIPFSILNNGDIYVKLYMNNTVYIDIYSKAGDHIGSWSRVGSDVTIYSDNENVYLYDVDGNYYELTLTEGQIALSLSKVNNVVNIAGIQINQISRIGSNYAVMYDSGIYIMDSTETVKKLAGTEDMNNSYYMIPQQNYVDVIVIIDTTNVWRYRYDWTGQLLSKVQLLKNLSAKSLNVSNAVISQDGDLYIDFSYVPESYGISFNNTMVVKFDDQGEIKKNYIYGSEDGDYSSKISILSTGKVVLIYRYYYQIIE